MCIGPVTQGCGAQEVARGTAPSGDDLQHHSAQCHWPLPVPVDVWAGAIAARGSNAKQHSAQLGSRLRAGAGRRDPACARLC